ncbi:hypothetical protein [Ralstonia phage RP13]|nr:hypothetical protein [Ralstonia phage RP13]
MNLAKTLSAKLGSINESANTNESLASLLLAKNGIKESAPKDEEKLDIDNMTVDQVTTKLLQFSRAHYPGIASKLKVKSDGKNMWTEIPGEDRTYCMLDLDTGKMYVIGD